MRQGDQTTFTTKGAPMGIKRHHVEKTKSYRDCAPLFLGAQ